MLDGTPPPKPVAAFHFGFELTTRKEVREYRERLRGAGVRELEWEDDEMSRLRVADPDGYGVEVFSG